ncbi:MAG: hypothetical protein ACRC2H_01125 [Silanimonas sp.]
MKTHSEAQCDRDVGIQRSADKAERIDPGWIERAISHVQTFARKQWPEPFLAEDARTYAEGLGLPQATDGRAWGHVLKAAAKRGIVTRAGFGASKSSNLSPKVLWRHP